MCHIIKSYISEQLNGCFKALIPNMLYKSRLLLLLNHNLFNNTCVSSFCNLLVPWATSTNILTSDGLCKHSVGCLGDAFAPPLSMIPHDFPSRFIPASTSVPGKPCSSQNEVSKARTEPANNAGGRESQLHSLRAPQHHLPIFAQKGVSKWGFFIAFSGYGGIVLSGICLGVTCDSEFGNLTAHRN